jgi:B9 domain-containing protein 2
MPSSGIIENTNRRRYFADRVPEIHLLGEVRGAEGYFSSETVSCSWSIDLGQTWISLAGSTSGQTQYCIAQYDGSLIWNHPLDLHLTAKTLNGWPRILLQLWKLDRYGRATVAGYGYCDTPCTPGVHESDVECWMPCGSFFEEIHSYFMGNPRDLKDSNYVFKEALSSRCQLVTKSAGTIKICITTLVRYFDDQNVDI